MRRILAAIQLLALSACFAVPSFAEDVVAPRRVVIPEVVPFAEGAYIAENIKAECGLPVELAKYLNDSLKGRGLNVIPANDKTDTQDASVLELQISSAFSSGNAFTGHRKAVSITGRLTRNGEKVASFVALRESMGGFLGGFKGSCTVLHRCAKELADDVAEWLESPKDNAKLGDAH